MDLQTIINLLPQLPQKEVPSITDIPFFKRGAETPVLTPEEFKSKMSLNPLPPQQESIPINWDMLIEGAKPEVFPVNRLETPQESIPIDWDAILKGLLPETFPISEPEVQQGDMPIDWDLLVRSQQPYTMGAKEGGGIDLSKAKDTKEFGFIDQGLKEVIVDFPVEDIPKRSITTPEYRDDRVVATKGRVVTKPIVMTVEDINNPNSAIEITDGWHRWRQAVANGDKTIKAKLIFKPSPTEGK